MSLVSDAHLKAEENLINAKKNQLDYYHNASHHVSNLTFLVISISLAISGFILQQTASGKVLPRYPEIFLVSSINAGVGIIWRFFWNTCLYSEKNKLKCISNILHWVFITCTLLMMIALIFFGHQAIKNIRISS